MNLYGIRNKETGLPIGISIFSNEGSEFCNGAGVQFELRGAETGDPIYMVCSKSTAERALQEDPDWYNASLERPQWPDRFNPSNWEVFSINVPVIGE